MRSGRSNGLKTSCCRQSPSIMLKRATGLQAPSYLTVLVWSSIHSVASTSKLTFDFADLFSWNDAVLKPAVEITRCQFHMDTLIKITQLFSSISHCCNLARSAIAVTQGAGAASDTGQANRVSVLQHCLSDRLHLIGIDVVLKTC